MIRRKCPKCGMDWYSASTRPWLCGKCGAYLTEKHEKSLNEGRETNAATGKFRRQEP